MSTPRAYATVTGPTATYTAPDGHTEPVHTNGVDDIRLAVVARAADEARHTGGPVELITTGDRGDHRILVHTDGAISPVPATPRLPSEDVVADVAPASVAESAPSRATRRDQPPVVEGEADSGTPRRRSSFIAEPTTRAEPASGWRGLLVRVGITVGPSKAEQARSADVAVVSRQWAGCRTIAVVNGKGGVGKTMTTAMLAAVYARHGGGNVLAWDNNDTRGTLGWRTQQGLYDTTIRDLLPAVATLLGPDAEVSDIARFVHHQAADRYDVLRSNPELLAADQRLSTAEFDRLMRVAARYYRLVIFDSGNDESADRWLRMVDDATQLVIPTLPNPESAESAALLLDALHSRDAHCAQLAAKAIVVVTQPEPRTGSQVRDIAAGFTGTVRSVQVVPFDPALKAGPLRYDSLRASTRDAWLRTAAHAAAELHETERGREE